MLPNRVESKADVGVLLRNRLLSSGVHFGKGLHEPVFLGKEKEYVFECLETGFVSSTGPFVERFENELAEFVGADHTVAVTNGTAALHLALVVAGVRPGDTVIVPALSFAATASAVVLAGATPQFVDVSPQTWGMDAQRLRSHLEKSAQAQRGVSVSKKTGQRIAAVVPMHTLGHPCDLEGISAVAEEFGMAVVEDAAESLGSFSNGVHTGLIGDAGIFSFNGNKTITTGGGGAIVTNDSELAKRAKHLSTTAKLSHRFEFDHDSVGYNYRMPNINAALGLAQLERLPDLVADQRSLYAFYNGLVDDLQIGSLRSESPGTQSNYWLQAFLLEPELADRRDDIINACLEGGIPVRPLWRPLNSLRPYRNLPSAPTPVAEDLYQRVICFPSSASIVC